jgi:hypothetical protein
MERLSPEAQQLLSEISRAQGTIDACSLAIGALAAKQPRDESELAQLSQRRVLARQLRSGLREELAGLRLLETSYVAPLGAQAINSQLIVNA